MSFFNPDNKMIPTMSPKDITEEHFYKMCNANLGTPIALGQADLKKPFIYQRGLGIMYCPSGYHCLSGSLLLAFNMKLMCGIDAAKELTKKYNLKSYQLNDISKQCDYWLMNTEGTAMLSSVAHGEIIAGKKENLNKFEQRFFNNIRFLS